MGGPFSNSAALEKKPQLFLCQCVHRCESKVQPAARAVVVATFQIDLAPAAIPQPMLVRILYPAPSGNHSDAYVLTGQNNAKDSFVAYNRTSTVGRGGICKYALHTLAGSDACPCHCRSGFSWALGRHFGCDYGHDN
jgi:hypothetical protein